ncbi:MAG: hypothetical protein HFE97_10510 [Oscillospiraceae bacterium]|nr:hypothetical protein [Oscillospiraceae bacterium]
MRKLFSIAVSLLLVVSSLAGCSASSGTPSSANPSTNPSVDPSAAPTKITIGCMPLNQEGVEALKELAAPLGYDIEVKVFDGNNLPAEALMADEIDALILNHLPWINNFNKEKGSNLVLVDGFRYASLMALYSAKHDSIEDIPDGGTIIVSNDPSNMDRSLRLLEKLNLLTLGEKTGEYYTILDIAENPKSLQIVEVETTNTAGAYQDADATICFSSVMRNAGYDAYSYLAEDGENVNYPTGLVVNSGDENSQWAKDLVGVTQTEEFAKRFDEIFQGAYMLF